ncbi:MAG: hypothetical protein ACM32E_17005 [Gemmatimonadota bacterium]
MITRILLRPAVYRHPYAWDGALLAAGLWLFILGAILCGICYWWGGLLIAVAALQVLAGCLLLTDIQRQHVATPSQPGANPGL